MSFSENLAHNKKVPNVNMSKIEMDMLAVLCDKSFPCVKRGFIVRKTCSYYIPLSEYRLDFVERIFAKYGFVTVRSTYKDHMCLRVEHVNKEYATAIVEFMSLLDKRRRELTVDAYKNRGKSVWWDVQKSIDALERDFQKQSEGR